MRLLRNMMFVAGLLAFTGGMMTTGCSKQTKATTPAADEADKADACAAPDSDSKDADAKDAAGNVCGGW